jgi:two-component sensor histidine kinase
MPPKLRVLILEDRTADAELIVHELRRAGFDPEWQRVDTEPAYLARLDPPPDIILADYHLPAFDAPAALSLLQAMGLDVPFLVVTGSLSEEVAVECMKQGAADYLLKDRLTRLGPAVARALEQKRLRDGKRQAEEQIKASLQLKEVLLREIHHRVKNNLQVISSLLKMQARQLRDPQARALFQESQNRVRAMALIHEKLHRSPDLARVDMADYIRSLATCLCRSAEVNPGQVTLTVDVAAGPLGIDTAIPCGLIINELVSNALKHAFPQGQKGAIGIDLRLQGEKQLALTVRDNGVGLPGHVDVRHTESLGWQLVNALTHQLGGVLDINNETGTSVRITFEELKYRERWAHHGQCTDSSGRR